MGESLRFWKAEIGGEQFGGIDRVPVHRDAYAGLVKRLIHQVRPVIGTLQPDVQEAPCIDVRIESRHRGEILRGRILADEAAKFIAQPYAQDAVKLRRWDDLAKVADVATPGLEHYLAIAATCVAAPPPAAMR